MQRRRRERARDGWPPTADNNNGPLGMELVGTGDEADGADGPPGHADLGEDVGEEDEGEQSFIEGTQGARNAARAPDGKSSDDNVRSGGGALIFEDDDNKSAMLDSEVVS